MVKRKVLIAVIILASVLLAIVAVVARKETILRSAHAYILQVT